MIKNQNEDLDDLHDQSAGVSPGVEPAPDASVVVVSHGFKIDKVDVLGNGGALLTELGLPPLERMPLLFIYGKEKNTMFHTQAALALIDAAEGSAQFGLEGAAHWCYKQKEDECVRLVRTFLNDNAKNL